MLTGLVLLRSCAGNGSSCAFLNGGILSCPADTVPCSRPPQHLGFCNHSTPIPSVMVLSEPWWKEVKMSRLWAHTNSTDPHPLHFDLLSVSVLTAVHCPKTPWMKSESRSVLWVERSEFIGSLVHYACFSRIIPNSPLGPVSSQPWALGQIYSTRYVFLPVV